MVSVIKKSVCPIIDITNRAVEITATSILEICFRGGSVMVRKKYVRLFKKGSVGIKVLMVGKGVNLVKSIYNIKKNLMWSESKNKVFRLNNYAIFISIIADLAALTCLYIDEKWVKLLAIFIVLLLKVALLSIMNRWCG
jgi:hypothetical protein